MTKLNPPRKQSKTRKIIVNDSEPYTHRLPPLSDVLIDAIFINPTVIFDVHRFVSFG